MSQLLWKSVLFSSSQNLCEKQFLIVLWSFNWMKKNWRHFCFSTFRFRQWSKARPKSWIRHLTSGSSSWSTTSIRPTNVATSSSSCPGSRKSRPSWTLARSTRKRIKYVSLIGFHQVVGVACSVFISKKKFTVAKMTYFFIWNKCYHLTMCLRLKVSN